MKKRVITIEFKTDAPDEVVSEIAEQMGWQVESLNDGTLEMDEGEEPVNHDWSDLKVEVK